MVRRGGKRWKSESQESEIMKAIVMRKTRSQRRERALSRR